MANQKISDLNSLDSGSLADDDLFVLVDRDDISSPTGETKNITFKDLSTAINLGSGSLRVITDQFTLTTSSISQSGVTLSAMPIDSTDVLLFVRNAPSQIFGIDYTASGMIVSWNGLAIDGVLSVGDKITCQYQRVI